MKTYVVGTHQKRLTEALLMSTHNISFCAVIRKINSQYILLLEMWDVSILLNPSPAEPGYTLVLQTV